MHCNEWIKYYMLPDQWKICKISCHYNVSFWSSTEYSNLFFELLKIFQWSISQNKILIDPTMVLHLKYKNSGYHSLPNHVIWLKITIILFSIQTPFYDGVTNISRIFCVLLMFSCVMLIFALSSNLFMV